MDVAAELRRAAATGTLTTMSVPVGGAAASSLQYFISGITICESLDVQGTGFHNGQNCLDLYRADTSAFAYDPNGDLSPLAEVAFPESDGVELVSTPAGTRLLFVRATIVSTPARRSGSASRPSGIAEVIQAAWMPCDRATARTRRLSPGEVTSRPG